MSKSEEILIEDLNCDLTTSYSDDEECDSGCSNNSCCMSSANTSECGDVDDEDYAGKFAIASLDDQNVVEDDFELEAIKFEYPFNAEYEDIFYQEMEEELNNADEEEFDQDADNDEYYYEQYENEYNFDHCVGGMKFKHLADLKKVKQKFKRKRINPKRRIHHREMKKQQEQIVEKREQASNKIYIPPAIRYAENNYYGSNNNRQDNRNNSTEESQLQQAISQSVADHHVNEYARECGIEYNLLLALTQRELTAEDYDLLLQLDNTVKKKTVSENILDSLPCCTLNRYGEICQEGMPQVCEGDMCITCMCDFEEGEELRWVPKCAHIFHKSCIDNWLNNHSTCCPICRVEVNS